MFDTAHREDTMELVIPSTGGKMSSRIKQTDALHDAAIPLSKISESTYATTETPELILEFDEFRKLFEELAPEFLDPLEYKVFTELLEHRLSREVLAKELEIDVTELLRVKRRARRAVRDFLPAAIRYHEKSVLLRRQQHPLPLMS